MKTNEQQEIHNVTGAGAWHRRPSLRKPFFTLMALAAGLLLQPVFAASEAGMGDAAKEVVRETTAEVEQAGQAAAETARTLWQRIDEARLKNRTPDELVAWIIMGILVGAVAGMMTPLKPSGAGKLGRLFLGLAGAFIGGIVAHVGQFDFGWGPVLIRYEELFFSLFGAILIVVVGRWIHARTAKKKGKGQ